MRTIAFLQRRPDLSRAAFRAHYEEHHAPLALPLLEGLRHYVRNHRLDDDEGARAAGALPFDAISEFEYASSGAFDAMRARVASEEGAALRADELRFMHKPGNGYFAATLEPASHAARPAPGSAAKWIVLARSGSGARRAALRGRLREAAIRLERAGHAIATRIDVAEDGDPLGPPAFDVLLHAWAEPERGDALGDALESVLGTSDDGPRPIAVEERGFHSEAQAP